MNQSGNQNNSSARSIIRTLVVSACCIFTALTLFLLLMQWLIEQNLNKSIAANVFLMLLPLSLAIAGADMIRRSDRIPTGGKCILHPLLCLSGIFLTYLPYMTANKFPGGTVLVHMVFFAVIYGVITAAVCLISLAGKRHADQKEPEAYVSQFNLDKKNGKDK